MKEARLLDILRKHKMSIEEIEAELKKHVKPHAHLRSLHAKGAEIQVRVPGCDWFPVTEPQWRDDQEYRIKPEPESLQLARDMNSHPQFRLWYTDDTVKLVEAVIKEHES